MTSKRTSPRSPSGTNPVSTPLANALLVGTALVYGVWLLVRQGQMTWPPTRLLASAYTLSGCIALVGPIVLWRRVGGETALGELLWLTAGALAWVFNLAALSRGTLSSHSWITPLSTTTMGLTMLAVLLAGWRAVGPGQGDRWSWTNVTGWALGIFWVSLAVASLVPDRLLQVASR